MERRNFLKTMAAFPVAGVLPFSFGNAMPKVNYYYEFERCYKTVYASLFIQSKTNNCIVEYEMQGFLDAKKYQIRDNYKFTSALRNNVVLMNNIPISEEYLTKKIGEMSLLKKGRLPRYKMNFDGFPFTIDMAIASISYT